MTDIDTLIDQVLIVDEQIEQLRQVRERLWATILGHVGIEYQAGNITVDQLIGFADACREVYGPGYTRVWNRYIPEQPSSLRLRSHHRSSMLSNDSGQWGGPRTGLQHRPAAGQSVVYVLTDHIGQVLYIGSTENLSKRLSEHREKARWTFWLALEVANRGAAFDLEEKLISAWNPPLNRRTGAS